MEDSIRFKPNAAHTSKLKAKRLNKYVLSSKDNLLHGLIFRQYTLSSQYTSVRRLPPKAFSAKASADADHTNVDDDIPVPSPHSYEIEFNRVNCLVWVLHESSRSFSVAIHTLELARRDPELAMAWVGVDVHSWHKRIAYQVH